MRLRWDRRATADIKAIYAYITAHDPKAAKCVVDRIEKSISRLLFFPLSGRAGVKKGTRLLIVPRLPYIVVHRVRRETVDILAVLHAARRLRS
jgi:addiction module RelE/StbE family toxin